MNPSQKLPLLKAWYINLEKAADRRQAMESAFALAEIPVERVAAIDGNTVSLPFPGYNQRLYHRRHGRTTKPGEIGCYLSHIKAMEAFLEDGAPFGLICEDDLILFPHFREVVMEALKQSGGWNVLRLTGLGRGKPAPIRHLGHGAWLCVNFGRLKGAGAYVVDRAAAKAMVAGLIPMWLPWDHAIDREWSLGLRACSVYPFPASQTESGFRSSIQGGTARKLAPLRRWMTTYPYQAFTEVSRWLVRGCQHCRLKWGRLRTPGYA